MNSSRQRRVAFILNPETWLGGRNYFRNLLSAFSLVPNPQLVPVLFTGHSDANAGADFPNVKIVRTPLLDRRSLSWVTRKIVGKLAGGDPALHLLLKRHEISILSHSEPLARGASMPSIGWVPDFQHVHVPEFFGEQERRTLDATYMRYAERCDRLIVSSNCAMADFRAFAPQYSHKGEVLRFVATLVPPVEMPDLPDLQQRHNFTGPFFLLPNQFWKHKNHRVVVTALKLLKTANRPVTVLSTGSTRDHRHPEHFAELMKYAEECGVVDQFRVLGVIPFADLSALMHHSVALINPSRFEGWSTSVEESKTLGKRILLSDIPVHREQAPSLGTFFSPDDAEALAEGLWGVWIEFDPATEAQNREDARRALRSRQLEFGGEFHRILLRAL